MIHVIQNLYLETKTKYAWNKVKSTTSFHYTIIYLYLALHLLQTVNVCPCGLF